MPSELRLARTMAVWTVLVIACVAGGLALHAAEPAPSRLIPLALTPSYWQYVPVVVKPSCNPQSWKGLAGFEDSAAASRAMCDMHIGSVYQWQQVYSKPFLSAYPLPGNQPVDMVKSTPNEVVFVGFNGMQCNIPDRLSCVADAVRGQGSLYLLLFNEPDNPDANYGDNLNPALAASRFKVISDTLFTANPSLKLVVGNFLWACGDYRSQFIASYIAQYGVDPSPSVYSWGYHVYGNVGTHGSDVMANFQEALNCAVATANGKPLWITEWGADSTGTKSNAYDASYFPAMCAALTAAHVERAFYFIGNRGVLNPSVMNADGSLSAAGIAYGDC